MAKAKDGDSVRVHYTGKLDDGEVFDTSRAGDPLSFEVGSKNVIPGFEAAIVGMAVGETKCRTVISSESPSNMVLRAAIDISKRLRSPPT